MTSGQEFQRNGTTIVEIIKEAVFQTNVRGFKGEYDFERESMVNSGGFTPITLTMHYGVGKGKELIAIYKSNRENGDPLQIFYDKIKWKTRDGLPPKDSAQIVEIQEEMIGLVEFSLFTSRFYPEIASSTSKLTSSNRFSWNSCYNHGPG